MLILPIRTPLLHPGDDLSRILVEKAAAQHAGIRGGDILVISSKIVATTEGRIIDLAKITPSKEAEQLSASCGKTPQFCEAVLREMKRMNGHVLSTCPGAVFTEVKPDGLSQGTILVANAGLDGSNAPQGHAIGWPEDAAKSVAMLRREIAKKMENGEWRMENDKKKSEKFSIIPTGTFGNYSHRDLRQFSIAVALSDSCLHPRRSGVIAFALAVSGFDPVRSCIGEHDLFGREMKITREAVADQLATAANFLMGNVAQRAPAVIIRDHGISFTDFEGWVPGIRPEEDLFGKM